MNGVLIALIGLVSALVGGAIQALATGKFERSKFERETKWQLYSSYFVTLGELSFTKASDRRHLDALAMMAQIRGRIGIYGSDEVISAVGNVFRFADLKSPEAQQAMCAALKAMRRDAGQPDAVSDEALKQIMFGSRETLQ